MSVINTNLIIFTLLATSESKHGGNMLNTYFKTRTELSDDCCHFFVPINIMLVLDGFL